MPKMEHLLVCNLSIGELRRNRGFVICGFLLQVLETKSQYSSIFILYFSQNMGRSMEIC